MYRQIRAVYRNGIFKPLHKLNLPEEKIMKIIILEDDLPNLTIASVAEKGGSYDFLQLHGEDIYTSKDGEELANHA